MPGEGDVHYIREELAEFVGYDICDVSGVELSINFFDVFSVLYRGNDRGVCTWPAYAFLLEGFYEGGLGIPGGRLGKILFGLDVQRYMAGPREVCAWILTLVVSYCAGFIWQARKRRQMRS